MRSSQAQSHQFTSNQLPNNYRYLGSRGRSLSGVEWLDSNKCSTAAHGSQHLLTTKVLSFVCVSEKKYGECCSPCLRWEPPILLASWACPSGKQTQGLAEPFIVYSCSVATSQLKGIAQCTKGRQKLTTGRNKAHCSYTVRN